MLVARGGAQAFRARRLPRSCDFLSIPKPASFAFSFAPHCFISIGKRMVGWLNLREVLSYHSDFSP